MKPDKNKTKKIDDEQCIQIGESTWNPKNDSIRNCIRKNGKFSRSASSELSPWSLKQMVCHAAKYNLLKPNDCKAIIRALTESIQRQNKKAISN